MKGLNLASAALAGAVVISAGTAIWFYTTATPDLPEQRPATEPAVTAVPMALGTADAALTPEQQQLLQNPETLTFARQLEFQADVREFFQQADSLPMDERRNQAVALKARLAEYEAADQVTGAESLLVRVAMAKLIHQDEADQKEAIEALVDRYRTESEARHQAWLAQPKPQFDAYKQQEKQIVEEVMAMQSIPNGLDRNEYLRQRLLEARIAAENSGDTQ